MDSKLPARNEPLARKLVVANIVLTVVVLALVGAMRQFKIPLPEGVSTDFLPAVYSAINAVVAGLLVAALVLIRWRKVIAHRNTIHLALVGSVLFLLLYVVYHFTNTERHFEGTGAIRGVYFFFLITHVILAAASLPFILHTWTLAITGQFEKHRRLARFVFPVWLYVAATGPLCYVLLTWFGS